MILTASVMIVISMFSAGQGDADIQIVDGEDATPGQFPWQVAIFQGTHRKCGGSIIDRRHVISAAHCFGDDHFPIPRSIIAGGHDMSKEEPTWQNRSICHISRHPNHTTSDMMDLVILVLSQPWEYNERVQPIRLAPADSDQEGQVCTTSGWGAREYPHAVANNTPNILQYINTTIMNQQKCFDTLGKLKETEICAYDPTGNRSPCYECL
ncbi:unnamed protein product [Allacma fusca]|uniref:Peptidase S1 domain-containing protein n=1 Tax=Allacma fusca TaxID=39272 RepID=A0A8J2PYF9_9HEXA|nr:unnamed protein product [Allacma fusca]